MKTAKTPIKSQAKSQYNNNNKLLLLLYWTIMLIIINNQHNRPDVSISPAY
jgi:hypothetical protein